jgi:hypothetical protein
LQCDVLQHLVASGPAFVGKPVRGAFHRPEDGRAGCYFGILRSVEPRSEGSCAFLKASRGLPPARILRHACEVVMQSVQMIERVAQPNETWLECAQI